uniref:hypothetical protein n=1 Tax=Nonomuraea sp. CA-251285 TaxID=3240002 RepID=UPI003F498C42
MDEDTPLIVAADEIARRLRLPLPLDEPDQWLIEQAIRDAQTDVEAYLGRPISVREFTETGLPLLADGFRLKETPVVELVTVEWPPDGSGYTVTYRAGLDVAGHPVFAPIVRYVAAHAMWSEDVQGVRRRLRLEDTRTPTSISVTGQSISYKDTHDSASARPGSGTPGALPTLASLDRWRVAGRRVYQRPTVSWSPWPHQDAYPFPHWWW